MQVGLSIVGTVVFTNAWSHPLTQPGAELPFIVFATILAAEFFLVRLVCSLPVSALNAARARARMRVTGVRGGQVLAAMVVPLMCMYRAGRYFGTGLPSQQIPRLFAFLCWSSFTSVILVPTIVLLEVSVDNQLDFAVTFANVLLNGGWALMFGFCCHAAVQGILLRLVMLNFTMFGLTKTDSTMASDVYICAQGATIITVLLSASLLALMEPFALAIAVLYLAVEFFVDRWFLRRYSFVYTATAHLDRNPAGLLVSWVSIGTALFMLIPVAVAWALAHQVCGAVWPILIPVRK